MSNADLAESASVSVQEMLAKELEAEEPPPVQPTKSLEQLKAEREKRAAERRAHFNRTLLGADEDASEIDPSWKARKTVRRNPRRATLAGTLRDNVQQNYQVVQDHTALAQAKRAGFEDGVQTGAVAGVVTTLGFAAGCYLVYRIWPRAVQTVPK